MLTDPIVALATPPDAPVVPPEGSIQSWPVDLVFTGHFQRLARRLATEASFGLGTPIPEGQEAVDLLGRFQTRCGLAPAELDAWLAAWELDAVGAATFLGWQELTERCPFGRTRSLRECVHRQAPNVRTWP